MTRYLAVMDRAHDADLETTDPRARFGTAKHPDRPVARQRPAGMDDETVAALGKLSEAMEVVDHARGLLYAFHRHCGIADLTLQEATKQLRDAGHEAIADELEDVLVGRDIISGRWSFQVIEDYDANYWRVFRAMEERARRLAGGAPPHLYEAEMQYDEQTPGADDD
jgi:hypothetical protein